ncbi:hypothetical protein [Ferrimicrobium sp.]|uniref:hypothetical protein n=1 Tax=Ferrimicrobium sp. TaxID=2926050 RepID=UPI0026377E20|nr:hypothetical protein [Ferrimicrobium sp.]
MTRYRICLICTGTRDRVNRSFVGFTHPAPQIERESTGIGMGVTHTGGQFLGAPKLLIQGENRRTRQAHPTGEGFQTQEQD